MTSSKILRKKEVTQFLEEALHPPFGAINALDEMRLGDGYNPCWEKKGCCARHASGQQAQKLLITPRTKDLCDPALIQRRREIRLTGEII